MKQVCVIGLGQFGSHLARTLARMRCEVLAIDASDARVAEIRDDVHRAVIADARNLDALRLLITPEIDEAVVCLGESMESSILCTLHLAKLGVPRIRAKASSRDHAAILKAVGAHEIVFPERETAERMAQRIANPDLLDYLQLSDDYRVVEIAMPESFAGRSLAELHLRKRYNVMVVAIKNSDQNTTDFMPPADAKLGKGDTLIVLGKTDDIARLQEAD